MAILKLKDKESINTQKIPKGSFTLSSDGRIVSSTLPSSTSKQFLEELACQIKNTFQSAREQGFVLNEVVINFPTLKIVAKEMRSGFFVSLIPT